MSKFSIRDLLMITLIVAAIIATFILGKNTQISRTYAFSAVPATHDALQRWLDEEGWPDVTITPDGNQITLDATVSIKRQGRFEPDWKSLGYLDASLVNTVRATPWMLPKIIGLWLVVYLVVRFVRRRDK